MPLEYAQGGVLAEHAAVRNAVGMFDVSHLGTVRVKGTGAAALVNRCFTNDLDRIDSGQAQYTLCCDDVTGGVIDDLIVYRYSDDEVLCVPNAANVGEVTRRLADAAPSFGAARDYASGSVDDGTRVGDISVVDEHGTHAMIAVQGPASAELLQLLGLPHGHRYMSFVEAEWGGARAQDSARIVICRTGYTGEHGYELLVPAEAAPMLWDAALEAGQSLGIRPCGLAARDTLRTEMGYPLHGHELTPKISPVEAGLSWAVGWAKPRFWGRDALLQQKAAGPTRRATGLVLAEQGVPRPGMSIYLPDGDTPVGSLTSGTYSPSLRVGIGLALIDIATGLADGDEIELDVRGRRVGGRLTAPPFVVASARRVKAS